MTTRRADRWVSALAALAVAAVFFWLWRRYSVLDAEAVGLRVSRLAANMAGLYLRPWVYAAFLAVFALERLMPAIEDQPALGNGFAVDFLWFNTFAAFSFTIMPAYLAVMKTFYDANLSFLTFHAPDGWTYAARFALAFLAKDLIYWVHHYARHKVRPFWHFHSVHHSQKELSAMADFKAHPVEFLIVDSISFIPLFMLDMRLSTIMGLTLVLNCYNRVNHANLRTNYGILKHFLVTPQSHRVHHSIEERHRDLNFGLIFTVWDRLAGTLHADYDDYPRTGIVEERFPFEQKTRGAAGIAASFAKQFLYPFGRVYDEARGKA